MELTYPNDPVWQCAGDISSSAFFGCLMPLVPCGGVISLEHDGPTEDICSILNPFTVQGPDPFHNTTWPKTAFIKIAVSSSSIAALQQVANSHAEHEYADHVVVYNRSNEVIIDASDFCFAPFYVSRKAPQGLLENLEEVLPAKPVLTGPVYGS